jgi:uncharacterized membrane protein YeiB
MRGLFTMMFGASMALILQRALDSGESPAKVHLCGMFWLFVLGMIHFWFIWYGNLLCSIACVARSPSSPGGRARLFGSKPWLEHFAHGLLEWLWRSLARGQPQPLLKIPQIASQMQLKHRADT